MTLWVNGRERSSIDARDRGLHYGDGVFETMRVRRHVIRLLDFHLERLYEGCRRLAIRAPRTAALRPELERIAALRTDGVMKLILTRGSGARGYRPSGHERCTRIVSLQRLPAAGAGAADEPVGVRMCTTPLGTDPALAGLKTLNRLDNVLARAEWSDARYWEGLMRDVDGHIVCGTMSNFFVRRGPYLMTPMLDRCGIAGVMRRWVLAQADAVELRAVEGRVRWEDLHQADEVFMTNALAGIVSVAVLHQGRHRVRPPQRNAAGLLRARLELL